MLGIGDNCQVPHQQHGRAVRVVRQVRECKSMRIFAAGNG